MRPIILVYVHGLAALLLLAAALHSDSLARWLFAASAIIHYWCALLYWDMEKRWRGME